MQLTRTHARCANAVLGCAPSVRAVALRFRQLAATRIAGAQMQPNSCAERRQPHRSCDSAVEQVLTRCDVSHSICAAHSHSLTASASPIASFALAPAARSLYARTLPPSLLFCRHVGPSRSRRILGQTRDASTAIDAICGCSSALTRPALLALFLL